MSNQLENELENEMDAGLIQGFIGIRASQNQGHHF